MIRCERFGIWHFAVREKPCTVVSLEAVREARKAHVYRHQASRVLELNRREFARLYESGALFSKKGARVGRQLLLARQHLLRIVALLDELSGDGLLPPPRAPQTVDALYEELDGLLDRTTTLTQKTQGFMQQL